MTINEAIEALQQMRVKYGDVEVFFDCPKCLTAFTPDVLHKAAVHITAIQQPKERL